ncbi:MAG: sulfatase [Candidatus Rokubacteria bacterium]|nr:sulfatase [Candidatus Rokubacteria bacterium]
MNVIWIVADTFRRDHLGCYGNSVIRTPSLDQLAARAVRFDRHYVGGFPTMPARADHATGRWTMAFMRWEPLPPDVVTLAQLLSTAGFHTAACVDTPFYLRFGMNYDRGFQTFFTIQGQEGSATRLDVKRGHESRDLRAWWRLEADRNAPRTIATAMNWLERHYKEPFFLYVDTWDPHEPWDAPPYYTELYWPDYDGEVIQPVYGHWFDAPGLSEEKVRKAHATYCGEITMVDTWVGYLLRTVENMGLPEKTAIIFTSDHGFYFGEHGGLFGKMTYAKSADGVLHAHRDPVASWDHSPLYEELVTLPLLVSVPGARPGAYAGLTSAIDVMPTVLDCLGQAIPRWVEGRSLLPAIRDPRAPGRELVVSTVPFANPDDEVSSVDNVSRKLRAPLVTTVTSAEWAFLYTPAPGRSELYHLPSDPRQEANVVRKHAEVARDHHRMLLAFMKEAGLPPRLAETRRELRM